MPKVVDHQERRDHIAAAAAKVIAERGVDAVTMVGIGQAAGVTTGAVTHYFADKDEVILAALQWADDAMQTRAARAFERLDDPLSSVLEILPTDEARRREWQVWAVLAERATRSEGLSAVAQARDEAWYDFASSVLRRLRRARAIDPRVDPKKEAMIVVALIDGIGFDAAFNPARWPPRKQREIVRYYLARLAPPKHGRSDPT